MIILGMEGMVKTVLRDVGQIPRTMFAMKWTSLLPWCLSFILISLSNFAIVLAEDNSTPAPDDDDDGGLDKDAILGLALGFGFIIATTVCCCLTWCLCCKALSDPEKRKIVPLQFHGGDRLEMPREEESPVEYRRKSRQT